MGNARATIILACIIALGIGLNIYLKIFPPKKKNSAVATAPAAPEIPPASEPAPEPVSTPEPIQKFELLPPAPKATPSETPAPQPAPVPPVPAELAPPAPPAPADAGAHNRWLFACSAMLFENNKQSHDTLSAVPRDDASREAHRAQLKKLWGINSNGDLNRTIVELESRQRFDGCKALAKKVPEVSGADYLQALGKKSSIDSWFVLRKHDGPGDPNFLVAWDYGRAMNITRWGYTAGLLTEAEAYAHLNRLAPQMQAAYKSWAEMGLDYALGFELWSNGGSRRQVLYQLLTKPDSPWKTNTWSLNLNPSEPRP